MKQCPNCQAEVKADERFCGSCGARLEPSLPPQTNQPPQRTGRETVVLRLPSDLSDPPPERQPATDATLIAGMPAQPQSPTDATLIGLPAGVPPTQPPSPSTSPVGGGAYTGASLPPAPAMPPPAPQSGGGNIWKIIGIIAGIGVLACVLLAAGVYFFIVQPAGRALNNGLSTAQAGLPVGLAATISAGMETAVSAGDLDATDEPITNGDADATDEPQPTPAAGNSGALLHRDNFDDPAKSDFDAKETDSAIYKFVDGAYSLTVKKPKLIVWKTINGDYGNASISVDATIEGKKASAVGLIFHYADDKNFYLYTVDDEGRYELDVYKDDELTTLVDLTESSAINRIGKMNTLRVETKGDTIRLYANDTLLDELSDSTITKGEAAIVLNTFDDPNVTATFDNLVIRGIK